eukprot:TRINITY_DN6084_c0_g1_i2.p1 TRINITY_DN6084_c0_g1~~TRINITY_DN6084_c0_g1_i2.p1  ORF type:complete len:576 (+),score=133.94 TRINITY_DN6084_c0_g1_i2:294-2021(+)
MNALLPSKSVFAECSFHVKQLLLVVKNETPVSSEDILALQLHDLQGEAVVRKGQLQLIENLDPEEFFCSVRLRDLQIDNMTMEPYFVNLLYGSRSDRSILSITTTICRGDFEDSPSFMRFKKGVFVKELDVEFGELIVNVDDGLMKKIAAFGQEIARDLQEIGTVFGSSRNESLDYLDMDKVFSLLLNSLSTPKLSIGKLRISSLELILTMHAAPGVFVGVQRMPVKVAAVEINRLLASPDRFLKEMSATYLADLIIRSPLLIGSFDLIGNPTQIIAAITRGVGDLVQIPSRAIGDGPIAFAFALGEGVSSLLRNVSEGTLMSVSGFSSSVARNLDGLSGVRIDQITPPPQGQGLGSALGSAVSSLGQGVVGAVYGLFSAPVSGLMNGGLLGFAKGIGQGITGVVARPIGGALHFISHTTRGLAEATTVKNPAPPISYSSSEIFAKFYHEEHNFGSLPPLKLKLMAHLMEESYITQFYGSGLFFQDSFPLDSNAMSSGSAVCLLLTDKGLRLFLNNSLRVDQRYELLEFDARTSRDAGDVLYLSTQNDPSIYLRFKTTHYERRRLFAWLEKLQRL